MASGWLLDFVARLIRVFAIVACCFIVAGLLGFLTDVVRDTSKVQATRIPDPGSLQAPVTVEVDITAPVPSPSVERIREQQHSSAREVIDDVNDRLLDPFSFLIEGSEPWVQRLLYSALGLFVYGFLLLMLADWIHRRGDSSRRDAVSERERKAAEERRRTGTYQSPA
jgi:hypothetical protein